VSWRNEGGGSTPARLPARKAGTPTIRAVARTAPARTGQRRRRVVFVLGAAVADHVTLANRASDEVLSDAQRLMQQFRTLMAEVHGFVGSLRTAKTRVSAMAAQA